MPLKKVLLQDVGHFCLAFCVLYSTMIDNILCDSAYDGLLLLLVQNGML